MYDERAAGQDLAVDAADLRKRYGSTRALDGVDLRIRAGGVTGILGPNGAGKTTLIRALTTLTPLDAGAATVAGADVTKEPNLVRARIGVTGQAAALDDALTGTDNLIIIGRLRGLNARAARARAADLLGQFDLRQAGSRTVGGYSGGMRRRLDLACSLTVPPRVLFLDEPTTGLDPRSRMSLWDAVKDLAQLETTVILTTQYLEEADQLAQRVIVLNRGRIVADDAPEKLKEATRSVTLVLKPPAGTDRAESCRTIRELGWPAVPNPAGGISVNVSDGGQGALRVLDALRDRGIVLEDFDLHRPTLDDVFFALTSTPATKSTQETAA